MRVVDSSLRSGQGRPSGTATFLLPRRLTSFIGREAELEAASRLLTRVRLLTLTGPGGTGKTRLALHLADAVLDQYADGACFVELASVVEPSLVPTVTIQALDLPETPGRPPIETLKEFLREKHLLLVLDNFEHLLAAGTYLTELLATCAGVTLLVTSRIPLRVSGEQELPVAPLALAAADLRMLSSADRLASVGDAEAVRLFVDRAQAVTPSFTLTEQNASAVAELCRRLDGLPLAIELAAARARLLTPEEIVARLDRAANRSVERMLASGDRERPADAERTEAGRVSPLRFLSAGARDVPARHQTLRDTIAWSYDLLTPDEQALFRRLAIFVGGCTLDAIEAIGSAEVVDRRWALTPDEVLDGVESLIAKSLLRRLDGTAGSRFSMLETIREYGLEQLEQQGELLALRRWHVRYFLALAERAEPALRGPEQVAWMDSLEAEHDNMRAALEWSLGDASAVETTLRLASSLVWFWTGRTHIGEGRRWHERALARAGGSAAARLKALNGVAWLVHFQRDLPAAEQYLREALVLARELGDTWATAWTLQALGRTAYYGGDSPRARALGEESLAVARDLGDDWLTGWVYQLLGLAAYIAGDLTTARVHFESSVAIRRPLGSQEGLGVCLGALGLIALAEGDDLRALQLSREALIAVRQVFRIGVHNMMANFVALAARFGQPHRAVRLAGASARIGTIIAMTLIPMNQRPYDEALAEVHRELDDAAFALAWSEGQALSIDEAIAEALAVEAPSFKAPSQAVTAMASGRRSAIDLTAREAEVLRLIVAGKTTREIAYELSVSTTTVERHITHLYGKIGARGRADATAYALQHGVVAHRDQEHGGSPPP